MSGSRLRLYSQKLKDTTDELKREWNRLRHPNRFQDHTDKAEALCDEAGVSSDHSCGPVEWETFQKVPGLAYRIKIFQQNAKSRKLNSICCTRKTYLRPVNLYVLFNDNHYDAITSISGLIEKQYYCDFCDVGYSHREDHRTDKSGNEAVPISTFSTKRAETSAQMATFASERELRFLLYKYWTDFDEAWQEASTRRPLPSFFFSGRSISNDSCPGFPLAWAYNYFTSSLHLHNRFQVILTVSQ